MTDINKEVEARKEAEEAALKASEKPGEPESLDKFIGECLHKNELGDAMLFAHFFKDKFIYIKTSNQWLRFNEHHWDEDIMCHRIPAVEHIAQQYEDKANQLADSIRQASAAGKDTGMLRTYQKAYIARVKRLRNKNGIDACLDLSHNLNGHSLAVHGQEIDSNPWLLACKNGVIDLRTGKFRAGRPEDYLLKAVPHEWPSTGIDTPTPHWDAFLQEVFAAPPDNPDPETYTSNHINFLRRIFGYGITGLSTERFFLLLHGEHGQNGKGTFIEITKYILGALAAPIPAEMLLDQKNARSSAGPSPDIMALKGLRIAFASETDENRRFSASKVKWLTGGDSITARGHQEKHQTTFTPTHILCLVSNHPPHAPADDNAFWYRMLRIDFKWSFVDDPKKPHEKKRDKNLIEKLKTEAPGILAWLVRGCMEWQQQGINPPQEVIKAVEMYRFNEDVLARFIEACTWTKDDGVDNFEQVVNNRIPFADIYSLFKAWFLLNEGDEKFMPKRKKFSELLGKVYKKERIGGTVYFSGIALKSMSDIGAQDE